MILRHDWDMISLFYLVLLRWLIEKFRSWNKVEMDKNKKINLINTIKIYSRISQGLFLWSITLFL